MLLVLLAPVIAVILRFAPFPYFLVLYLCWVSSTWPVYEPIIMGWILGVVPVFVPAAMGLLFFSAGALCGINGKSLFALDRYGVAACIAFVPIVLADTIWYTAWFNVYLHRTGLLVGVVAALYSTKLILHHERLTNWIVTLGGASFFVYAAHEPVLRIVRTLTFKYIPFDWPYTMLVLYLAIPMVVVVLLVWCHRLLTILCPRTLSVITGGR
jgi:peptidoglycan/LPS O-acetylase OafA/YrhL